MVLISKQRQGKGRERGEIIDLDEILEKERGDPLRGAVHGPADEGPQIVRLLRQQHLAHILLLSCRHLPQLLRRHADSRGENRHALHRLRLHLRQAERHEPAVADPHHGVPSGPEEAHRLRDAPRLIAHGAIGAGGTGSAEEDEVRDIEVEGAG